MTDRREAILQRILAILVETIAELDVENPPTSGRVFRNRGDIPTQSRPAMVMLDGSESTILTHKSPRGGPSSSIMRMQPEIYALLKERPMDKIDEYGPEIAQYRNAIYKKIIYDVPLGNLMGDNGGIEFRGFKTDMQSASFARGELLLQFWFHYPLIPSELSEGE